MSDFATSRDLAGKKLERLKEVKLLDSLCPSKIMDMGIAGSDIWRVCTRVTQTFGLIGCLAVFVWSFGLIGHYTATRPYGPVPERGWIVCLPWCFGCYGTFEEKQQLLLLHNWFIPFFFVAFVGTWVRQLREKKEPWTRI